MIVITYGIVPEHRVTIAEVIVETTSGRSDNRPGCPIDNWDGCRCENIMQWRATCSHYVTFGGLSTYLNKGGSAMKEKLDAILRILDEAQQQIANAKAGNTDSLECIDALDDVEVGLHEIKEKLNKLRETKEGEP